MNDVKKVQIILDKVRNEGNHIGLFPFRYGGTELEITDILPTGDLKYNFGTYTGGEGHLKTINFDIIPLTK